MFKFILKVFRSNTPVIYRKTANVSCIAAGAAIGAGVGSIVPVIGTAIGATVGVSIGVVIGASADKALKRKYEMRRATVYPLATVASRSEHEETVIRDSNAPVRRMMVHGYQSLHTKDEGAFCKGTSSERLSQHVSHSPRM